MIHCAAPRRCTAQAGTEQISKSGDGIRASLQSTSVINLSSRQEINNIPNMRAALLDDAPKMLHAHTDIFILSEDTTVARSEPALGLARQFFEVSENLTKKWVNMTEKGYFLDNYQGS